MHIKRGLSISLLLLSFFIQGQRLSGTYKINDLLGRINNEDTTYVVNFWALWCKPCIQEIPSFDSLHLQLNKTAVKVLLVNLDFKGEAEEKVNAFLQKNKVTTQCVLLDEIDGNSYIDLISEKWTGAIPATLFKKGNKKTLVERKMNLNSMKQYVAEINNK